MDRFLAGVERRAFVSARIATGNDDDALDIVQDAMLRMARRYADRDEQALGMLFHSVLQSCIRDWYRRTRVRNRLRSWLGGADEDDTDPLDALPDAREPGPLERLSQKRSLDVLERGLQALPLRQQQAFLLRVWEGLDVAQTAAAMGCSQGSVKTHLSRALNTLRGHLEGHEHD